MLINSERIDLTDAALRERTREQIRLTVHSYLTENRHLEHVVDEIMLEVDRIGLALRDAARAEQREADQKAVCWYCRTGRPFTTDSKHYHVGVNIDKEPIEIHCVAAAIRAGGE